MKLDELKSMVADLFKAATDKETIEKSAIVQQKINEVQTEQEKLQEDYQALLKDYKDVILHTSFKPGNSEQGNVGNIGGTFNADEFISNFIENLDKKN